MTAKPEVYGVIWTDLMLGHLSLIQPDRQSAIDSALQIRAKGADKVASVRAVHLSDDDVLTDLIPREVMS